MEKETCFLIIERMDDGSFQVAMKPIPDDKSGQDPEGNGDPGMWGVVLADIVKHACTMYSDFGASQDEVRDRIVAFFATEMEKPMANGDDMVFVDNFVEDFMKDKETDDEEDEDTDEDADTSLN